MYKTKINYNNIDNIVHYKSLLCICFHIYTFSENSIKVNRFRKSTIEVKNSSHTRLTKLISPIKQMSVDLKFDSKFDNQDRVTPFKKTLSLTSEEGMIFVPDKNFLEIKYDQNGKKTHTPMVKFHDIINVFMHTGRYYS